MTPGPWIVRTFPTGGSARSELWVMDSLPDVGGKVVANAICRMVLTNPDDKENAAVIAAAPDLLAACQGFLSLEFTEASENLADGLGKSEDYDLVVKTFDAARAAIAKAEGTK